MTSEKIYCRSCGSNDMEKLDGGKYRCRYCNTVFIDRDYAVDRAAIVGAVGEALFERSNEKLAKLRSNLYAAVNAEYLDTEQILRICYDIQKIAPDDFMSNFYAVMCGENYSAVSRFLSGIDTEKYYSYMDIVLKFAIKLLSPATLLAVTELIERAFESKDPSEFNKWNEVLQEEAEKVESGIYDVTLPRDVFIAYKSEDMAKVNELVSYLENEENCSCFVAARNLRHGKISLYDETLRKAIDSCRAVVLVSSVRSRTSGDAREKELPYVMSRDYENAPQYRASNSYNKMPYKFKKPRAEYIVEEYAGKSGEKWTKTFFDGYERAYTPKQVAERLFEQWDNLDFSEDDSERIERQLKEEREKKADQLDAQTCFDKGREYDQKGDYIEAVKWYRKAAEQGHAEAQLNLGVCYEEGLGVDQNCNEALRWFRSSANQGNAGAQNSLGYCYANGRGVEESDTEAVEWYRKAAEQSFAAAQFNLGMCYEAGQGVEQNYLEAVKWYRKAADQGDEDAQNSLGFCYANGLGVEQSYVESAMWYKKAAEQGHVEAQSNLGDYYSNGRGVEQSDAEAVKWYKKAAEQGDELAKIMLESFGK